MDFVSRQLWTQAWAEISLCATLICLQVDSMTCDIGLASVSGLLLQFILVIMAVLLAELVRRGRENRVHPRSLLVQEQQAPQGPRRSRRRHSSLESELTSSTAPFFRQSSSPPLSAPPLSLRQFSLTTTPTPTAPPLNHTISALHYSNENVNSWDLPTSPTLSITKL